jgi:hypothetical protein
MFTIKCFECNTEYTEAEVRNRHREEKQGNEFTFPCACGRIIFVKAEPIVLFEYEVMFEDCCEAPRKEWVDGYCPRCSNEISAKKAKAILCTRCDQHYQNWLESETS